MYDNIAMAIGYFVSLAAGIALAAMALGAASVLALKILKAEKDLLDFIRARGRGRDRAMWARRLERVSDDAFDEEVARNRAARDKA
jgi:hypothetical protein